MKTTLLTLTTVLTSTAAGTSIYISTLPAPTDIQTDLSKTANTVVITGSAAIFGLLNDEINEEADKEADKEEYGPD